MSVYCFINKSFYFVPRMTTNEIDSKQIFKKESKRRNLKSFNTRNPNSWVWTSGYPFKKNLKKTWSFEFDSTIFRNINITKSKHLKTNIISIDFRFLRDNFFFFFIKYPNIIFIYLWIYLRILIYSFPEFLCLYVYLCK